MKTSAACVPFLTAALGIAVLPALASEDRNASNRAFDEAAEQYQKSRHSDAYGRFIVLANSGDRDAARIVLFMHRYGPTLYGSYWDASTEEVELWEQLSTQGGRTSPAFRAARPFRPRH